MSTFFKLARPALFKFDPETAHQLTIRGLKTGLAPANKKSFPNLKTTLWNLEFPNPVGLAAGFDKNAEVIGPMLRMGFGFVEVGTVTPKPQVGNPKPRVFREPSHQAVINRMGFPNAGLQVFKQNLQQFLSKRPRPAGVVGLNIGMNKDQSEPVKDYKLLIQHLAPLGDYLTINISSPNTPGLRDLQQKENLSPLLAELIETRDRICRADPPPLLLKLAPDLSQEQCEEISEVVLDSGIDGLVLTNTTLARPEALPNDFAEEKGGLSGAPLTQASTEILQRFSTLTQGKIPLIGAGGIGSAADARQKLDEGASLVQLYTGLVYHGPDLPRQICEGLTKSAQGSSMAQNSAN